MIQLAMLFALGFLVAGLLALAVMPFLSRRAERVSRARLERQMPISMTQIASERDQTRAAHAVTVRQLEQRIEGLESRNAALLGDTGRQATRLSSLEQMQRGSEEQIGRLGAETIELRDSHAGELRQKEQTIADLEARHATLTGDHARLTTAQDELERRLGADAETIARLEGELAQAKAALHGQETAAGAQAAALRDAVAGGERQREAMETATSRLAAAEALAADQRVVIAELEARLAGATHGALREPPRPMRVSDDAIQVRAAFGRLKAEHDIVRQSLDTVSAEREQLRFRVDELLLRIDELQEQAEDAGEASVDALQHKARQDKAIATLRTRVAAREEALETMRRLLAEETARRKTAEAGRGSSNASATRDDPAALRLAIATLAADLVRVAGHKGQDTPAPAQGRPEVSAN